MVEASDFGQRLLSTFSVLPRFFTENEEFRESFFSNAYDNLLEVVSRRLDDAVPIGVIKFENFHNAMDQETRLLHDRHFGNFASALHLRCVTIKPRALCILQQITACSVIEQFMVENSSTNAALVAHTHVGVGRYNTILWCSDEADAVALALRFS
jgi:hypothetical protein